MAVPFAGENWMIVSFSWRNGTPKKQRTPVSRAIRLSVAGTNLPGSLTDPVPGPVERLLCIWYYRYAIETRKTPKMRGATSAFPGLTSRGFSE